MYKKKSCSVLIYTLTGNDFKGIICTMLTGGHSASVNCFFPSKCMITVHFPLSLWDIFPISSFVVYYCEVFYLFWVQCLSQWLGCNFLIVEGVLPVAGVLHGQNLVQYHGKPGHSECLWWGSIPGEQHWRCNPTPPHFTSQKNMFWI